jgi:hypothetical protein
MIARCCLLPGLAVLLLAPHGLAQNAPAQPPAIGQPAPEDSPRRFWQAALPGGHYMVALDRITSISQQTYLLDGAVVVHEVDVDTEGQALARFYFLEPVKTPSTTANQILERGREIVEKESERSGTDVATMVVKKYPDTTHAKCLEYRLERAEDLDALYKSLREAWESGKGRKFTLK